MTGTSQHSATTFSLFAANLEPDAKDESLCQLYRLVSSFHADLGFLGGGGENTWCCHPGAFLYHCSHSAVEAAVFLFNYIFFFF